IFGRYLLARDLACAAGADPLTRELRHFVECVRTGSKPLVSGEDGRDAVALACRVLASLREHAWEGRTDGPKGPAQMPAPGRRAVATDQPQFWGHGEITPEIARGLIALADQIGSWADLDEAGVGYEPFQPFPIPPEYTTEVERAQSWVRSRRAK